MHLCVKSTSLNIQDYDGNTLLHWAINKCQDYDYINYLLELGSDPYIKDKNNENCIIHYPMSLALNEDICSKRKVNYLQNSVQAISSSTYITIIYDLFAATLNNNNPLQREIWKKSVELKDQKSEIQGRQP